MESPHLQTSSMQVSPDGQVSSQFWGADVAESSHPLNIMMHKVERMSLLMGCFISNPHEIVRRIGIVVPFKRDDGGYSRTENRPYR